MNASVGQMRASWNARAKKNPFFYVESAHWDGDIPKFYALGEERAKQFLDPFLAARPGIARKKAIDIGCGLGRFSRALSYRFEQVTGLDVSDGMISQAQTLNSEISNVVFLATDGISMPVADGSADFVFSYEVFQHMPTHSVIKNNLSEVSRILSDLGIGFIHLRTSREDDGVAAKLTSILPDSVIALAKRALNKDELTSDASWRGAASLSQAEIETLCSEAGLEIVGFHDDPTHDPGTRIFVEVKRRSDR